VAEVPSSGVFACALLNSQPMGFYAPAQIVRDAREHGVVRGRSM
jgi:error-prone DNA polymerase